MGYQTYKNRYGEDFGIVKGDDRDHGTNAIRQMFYKHIHKYVEITPKGHWYIDTVGITEFLADKYYITIPAEMSNLEDFVKYRIDHYGKREGLADAPSLDARRNPK